MDKAALLIAMQASGEINHFSHTQNWDKAFNLYNASHSDKKSPRCGSCYRDVKAWLLS